MKTVLYDEQCGFCCVMADWVIRLHTRAPLRMLPIQSPGGQAALASMPAPERLASWHNVRFGDRDTVLFVNVGSVIPSPYQSGGRAGQ